MFLHANSDNLRKALELLQGFSSASRSKCSIDKSRLILLTEGADFYPSSWIGEVISKGHVVRHLGVPLGVGITHKQAFDWVKLKVSQKIQHWQWMLLPMEGRIKVINSIIIPYVQYALPLMKLSTTKWEEILSPIKSFLWKNMVWGE